MSLASARDGMGLSIIEPSICVAVMTGFPASFALLMMSFCSSGTRSGETSTPRSPRATMMPSDSSMMSSRCSIAIGCSIFEMMGDAERIFCSSSRQERTSSPLRTKLIAT